MPTSSHKLVREQMVPRPLSQVFEFFSRAENLQTITPPWLSFNVLRVRPQVVRKGTLIDYRLKVHGLPLGWTSEIVIWEPPHRFVDVQVRGPYKLWHHTHRFAEESGGTRITDEVLYQLPLGLLGDLAHWALVRRDVKKIFEYRAARVRSLFG
ncbi:MAG TPA: SRPBCC family protein [Candidatus Angelobacter sp.]